MDPCVRSGDKPSLPLIPPDKCPENAVKHPCTALAIMTARDGG